MHAIRIAGPLAVAVTVTCLTGGTTGLAARAADRLVVPEEFGVFQRDVSPLVKAQLETAQLDIPAKTFLQIEPALHHLALQHADRLSALPAADVPRTLAALARFIDRQRTAAGQRPVFAPGRDVIGLLDPDRGLDPNAITAIAAAYGGAATVFKRDTADETIAGVADEFLAAVRAAATSGRPTTIVVLGHGLPTEIQSYGIRFERLADALLGDQAAAGGAASPPDLGKLVLVCDDCYSADFLINLQNAVELRSRDHGLSAVALPACIAGTNRGRFGFADARGAFVPHFWKDVVELYFIRRPRPAALVLQNVFENVDHMMYGYGRAPIFEGTKVTGWRLIDPAAVQDPVTFVPLDAAARDELRAILGLPATAPLPGWLDIG
ncbi:MAG: hypothetical protein ACK6CT_13440 [Planctomycetia bacterium]